MNVNISIKELKDQQEKHLKGESEIILSINSLALFTHSFNNYRLRQQVRVDWHKKNSCRTSCKNQWLYKYLFSIMAIIAEVENYN